MSTITNFLWLLYLLPLLSMMNCTKCWPCTISCLLVTIGALNWGLIGIGGFMGKNFNVVNLLLGSWPQVELVVYILVGVAGVMKLFSSKCPCNGECKK